MIDVYIVGEDDVTKEIIKKIIAYCSIDKINIIQSLPARGSQIKNLINNYNKLASSKPVILLMDLDANNCPPQLIRELHIDHKSDKLILNIAIDEAEAWLMADRYNFASYFQVDIDSIPTSHRTKLNGSKEIKEMDFPIKASLYLNTYIIPTSRSIKIRSQMLPEKNAYKGKEYNKVVVPFIKENWDVANAMLNSDSLKRMVDRIQTLIA